MSDATTKAILSVRLVFSVFIFIANTFTVFVFWIHRHKLKRTFLLVFNLTVADLLVGLAETVAVGFKMYAENKYGRISASFLAVFSGASVFFLVLIALERAFALIWPLRHRATSKKVYIYSVVMVWLAGITLGALSLLTVNGILDFRYYFVAYSLIIVLSLFVICLSYLSIRKSLNNRNPAIHTADCRKNVEQNKKISKTFFIVIGASIAFWAPSMTLHNLSVLFPSLFPGFVKYIFTMLHVTNSLVNPIIYSLRIAVFRKTLKQLGNKLKIRKRSKRYTL